MKQAIVIATMWIGLAAFVGALVTINGCQPDEEVQALLPGHVHHVGQALFAERAESLESAYPSEPREPGEESASGAPRLPDETAQADGGTPDAGGEEL